MFARVVYRVERFVKSVVREDQTSLVFRSKSDASFRGRFNDSSSSVARRTTHTHTYTHTEIQQVEIIRLCGRSSPETRSHVPNKAARRCAASSGIKGCGSTVPRSTRPFRKEICFYAIHTRQSRNRQYGCCARTNESSSRRGQSDRGLRLVTTSERSCILKL